MEGQEPAGTGQRDGAQPGWQGTYYQHPPPAPPPAPMAREDPLMDLFRTLKAMLWSTAFISFLAVLILSFIIVLAMTPEIQNWITTPVPSTTNPGETVLPHGVFFIIFPFPVLLFTFSGIQFQAWHLLMLSILVLAFAAGKHELWKEWLSERGRMLLSLTSPEKANSSLESVAKLFMATSFFSVVYFIMLSLGNISMNTPSFDQMSRPELIYGLFNASVFEELVSRLLLVGVPLALVAAARQDASPLKRLLGGGLGINYMTLGLITFSAIFFALAHVGSWDFWKVPQVLVTGFALGYAFVRFGLHASILVHFSINLSSSAMDIWPGNTGISNLLGILFFIWIVMGGYFFFEYIWRLLKKLGVINKPKSVPQSYMPAYPPAQPPAPVQYPPAYPPGYNAPNYPPQYRGSEHQGGQPTQGQNGGGSREKQPERQQPPQPREPAGFICPNCGHTGAVYSVGKLTCIRCGTTYGEEKAAEPEGPDKEMFEF